MYYGRKKGIIIAVVIVAVVILLAVAGVLTFMFTDLFKSDKVLFWKYAGKELMVQMPENTQLQDVEKMKKQSPYTVKSNVGVSSTDENINKVLETISVNIESQTDKTNNYSYTNAQIGFGNTKLLNVEYVNDDDIYALKSDEIVTVYLGVRNENLKVLFQKLGLTDVSGIPDEITPIDFEEILEISEEEKEHIKQTYTDIIINNISDDSYSKQTGAVIEKDGISYDTTSYRLDLAGSQIMDLLVNVLSTLQTDSITLNLLATKAKLISEENEDITIEDINSMIDDILEDVQEIEFPDISFVVYSYKGDTIATEILIKNEQKMTIYNEKSNIKMVVEDLTGESEYENISMNISYAITSTESSMSIGLSKDEEEVMMMDITNTGSAIEGSLETTVSVTIANGEDDIVLDYNQTLEFVDELEDMENLDQNNCAILNDYTQDQLNTLMEAVVQRIVVVMQTKYQDIATSYRPQARQEFESEMEQQRNDINKLIDAVNEL